ncbi:MAG: ComF family protein [bacterium]|nr:ComF family protein [bacterium]
MWKKAGNFILEILFPQFCFNCGIEGTYLCEDCKSILEITGFHQKYSASNLKDLYFALSYDNPLSKKLIQIFKCEPFVKELTRPLSSLIIAHFQLMDNKPDFSGFLIIPVPLGKRRMKWRGFNQSREIVEELASSSGLGLKVLSNILIKTKETLPQVELSDEERKKNIKGVFFCQNQEKIRSKKILLVDDVYTTGATMAECARILRESGAKEIIGIAIARG